MDAQRVHRLYEHADVVRQILAENFVYLPRIALGTQALPNLPFIMLGSIGFD
jgi:hypothetical protein